MKKKDKNILKKGLIQTNDDFTSNLMSKINAEEKALNSVLSQYGTLEAPVDFSAQVMQKLEGKVASAAYTPVISKRVWTGIAVAATVIVLLALIFDQNTTGNSGLNENVEKTLNGFQSFFTNGSIFLYLLMCTLLFSIGLVIEQRLNSNQKLNSD
jgi:hypothetical protein